MIPLIATRSLRIRDSFRFVCTSNCNTLTHRRPKYLHGELKKTQTVADVHRFVECLGVLNL